METSNVTKNELVKVWPLVSNFVSVPHTVEQYEKQLTAGASSWAPAARCIKTPPSQTTMLSREPCKSTANINARLQDGEGQRSLLNSLPGHLTSSASPMRDSQLHEIAFGGLAFLHAWH